MRTITIIGIIGVLLVGGAILFVGRDKDADYANAQRGTNVSMVDGTQVITIDAKGGYKPRVTAAQSGMPTVIKMNTAGTFDCSSALTIPQLGYRTNLPPSGETLIDVPPQASGAVLRGLCSMGMYNFEIRFK